MGHKSRIKKEQLHDIMFTNQIEVKVEPVAWTEEAT